MGSSALCIFNVLSSWMILINSIATEFLALVLSKLYINIILIIIAMKGTIYVNLGEKDLNKSIVLVAYYLVLSTVKPWYSVDFGASLKSMLYQNLCYIKVLFFKHGN